jgi:glutamate synthase domain-containing protein 2
VIHALEHGAFKEFERHSRVGMVSEESFRKTRGGARGGGREVRVLKTGAYRPDDLARAIAFSSKYGVDMLTVDGARGGTA